MRMWKGKKSKMVMGALLALALIAGILITPLQYAFAYGADGAQDVGRGKYYDLPETVEKYVSSGKTLEFDLNFEIQNTDNCQLKLYNDATQVSGQFFLKDGANGLSMKTEELSDGWYHYIIFLASVPHSNSQTDSSVNRIRVITTFPDGAKINNITIGIDLLSLPEAFTNDYDEITLADLGLTGKDFETSIQKSTYVYNGKSSTKSVILRFGWRAKITNETDPDTDFRFALDSLYNANCMVWFRPDKIYFCPGQGKYAELKMTADPVTDGEHQIEFGRLRVTQGQNYGKDYIYLKIDGNKVCEEYTNYYQTEGGYVSHMSGEEIRKTSPSYTVAFLGDGLSQQTFSGFAAPDKCAEDTDFVNIGDIVPGGVVKDSVHDGHLGYTYHFDSLSETHSTVVKYVLKTGDFKDGALDGSVMVVDIGGNCGFCRSYISSGDKRHIMFGWEIDGCVNGTNSYKFESNTWYAFEQGRRRVISGLNAGKDYVYIKIDGKIISYFYAEPTSRPLLGQDIYVEATEGFEVMGYDELHANYYVDDNLYLDQLAQRGFPAKQPEDPKKDGSYFVGWYTEKTGGELFDFKNTKLTESIDLYARFTTETVNVTFKPANGEASSNNISGKGCLVTEPSVPTYTDGVYEYVFVGWKNESTGKIFDFKVDRLSDDTTFIAQYEEKKYYVSYYANGKLVKKVPFLKSDSVITGNEPEVPSIPNTIGVWEPHATEGLTGNMTVNAVYTTTVPSASNDIKLNKYDGGKIYINTDTVHSYLSTDISKQSDFIKEYTASIYKYQDYQNTSFEWNDSGDNSEYTVYFADNSSFNNAYIIKTEKASLVNEVGVFVPGKTYYWFVCGNNTGKCSAIDSFKVVNTPVRYINAGSVINMRDLGGQVNSDGDKVRYELIYRGAALDEYTSHIDDKARGVFNYLGIKSEIELRGGNQHNFTGWDENNPNAYYVKGAMYQEILPDEDINSESIRGIDAEQKGQYKAVFEALADSSNYPFYFHCSAGADRTGTLAYLLYGLLGVPYEDIRPEYELTSFSAIGKRTGDLYSGEKSLDETNRIMIDNYSGGTGNLQTAIENYLINVIGLDSSTLESIKNILLDENAEPNEQQYTITVDVLGKKSTYKAFGDIYFMPDAPMAKGKLFKGFYIGNEKYDGYTNGDITLTARFDDIEFEPYDVISLKDLGIDEAKIINQSNKLYNYNGIAKSGGRSFQFILEPIGDMNSGDGPQIALTNDWDKNSFARVWFQTNSMAQVYYNGVLGSGPDISKSINLESGKQYNVEYAVRIMKNKGYEGKKVFEVSVDGELLVQYIGCKADLDNNTIYFHGGTGSAYLINKVVTNENLRTVTVDVLGKKSTYKTFSGEYFMPEEPKVMGKLFKGYYVGSKKYDGYTTSNITLTANFEDIEYESYDVISLKDLGIKENRIINQTNKLYTYDGIAKSGGRLLQFTLEPIGDMNGGDGPQISFTNNWSKNSFARVWFQTNSKAQIYYNGKLGSGPDITKTVSLESGKQYDIQYAVRIMKNKGYEGKKVFEVSVDGEVLVQYIGCDADLSEKTIYFHGSTGSAYFINKNVTNENLRTVTVDVLGKKTTYNTFSGEYFMPEEPKVMGKLFKGYYVGSKKYDGYTTSNITLTAEFEDIEFESYDAISLKDLGIKEDRILNQTNKLYTYDGIAKSGGRLLQFTLEPIGDMNGGDGPQISFTNNWSKNSFARVWFQTNSKAQIYYNGKLGSGPDITKTVSLESGKQYDIQYAIRIMKNKGYEGKKVFEVSVDGEVLIQYIGCEADLSEKTIYFHGSTGSAYFINKQVSNERQRTVTVDVLGKKTTYKTFMGEYFMPEEPKVIGKFFKGFYIGDKEYSGYTYDNITLTAKFEDIEFEPYDTISLKDLGIKEEKTLNKTNTVYTYEKTAESGGRLLQFILEPIGDMKGGDGPQVALTSDWAKNSFARVWFQNNKESHVYYNGALGSGPDITKSVSLESGKQYEIQYAIRIMKSKGYEGKKLFEVSVNGELIIQYIGCNADLDNNTIYFHGGTGSAYLINNPVYKTVNFFNGNYIWASYKVERSGLIPRIQEPSPKDGLPFAGWYTATSGSGKLWDENEDVVLNDMNLFAHFANVRLITANVDGKIYIYRVEVGKTLDELPKPKKPGNVFMGWLVNGKPFTGKVTSNLDITASFEPYSFDDYDEISLRDLGIYTDLDFAIFGDRHTRGYNYYKAAKTGGRVFKAIYIPPENMINGPQVSFSTKWDENYFAKLYFTKYDKLYVYSSGIDGGLPTLNMDTELAGGKEYFFEIGVRVLNNKGYKGVKVLTVYINGELIFEEFDNKANIEGDTVFFQGLPNTGIFRNVDIYKTVSFYDGEKLVSSAKVLRGDRVKSIGSLANKGDRLFLGWYSEYGHIWDFDLDLVYLDTVLKAKYRMRTYPVLLMVDDVLYKRLNVSAGESVDIFDTPYKEGYEFDKWLSEDGSEYDLSTPVKAPTTLFASFKLSAKPSSSDGEVDVGGQEKSGGLDFKLILFSAIGLAFIGAETGIIIFKKRSKR